MKAKRRMTFQLTPLLDLLLIVIFAQYMEVQQKAESAQDDLQQERAALVQRFDEGKAELERQRLELQSQISKQSATLTETRERYGKQFENIVRQHQQAGQTLAEAFNLPGTVMEEILRLRTDGNSTDAANLEKAAERLKQMLPQRGDELLQFVLRYDEMQKHVSVWELHILDNGQAMFSDGEQVQSVSFGTREEFVSRSFQSSKSFTEPKPLVIILLTYGDTQAGQLARAVDGMPQLMEQLRRDAGNTRWFDYSLMGFRPAGPLFGGQKE